jgi:hypothetical protein
VLSGIAAILAPTQAFAGPTEIDPANGRERMQSIAGPIPSIAQIEAFGPLGQAYVRRFRTFAEKHWADAVRRRQAGQPMWEIDYYNCGAIEYLWWAASGEQEWFDRGRAKALDYRTFYLEGISPPYSSSHHWAMLPAILYDWLATQDPKSRTALGMVASHFGGPWGRSNIINKSAVDQRVQARIIQSLLYARLAGYETTPTSPTYGQGQPIEPLMRELIEKVLSTQEPDGSYLYPNGVLIPQLSFNKPFMVALWNYVLGEYYDHIGPEPRILEAVQRSANYMWERQWDARARCWHYPGPTPSPTSDGDGPAPDLNGLMLPVWGWLHAKTKRETYYAQATEILRGMGAAWLAGTKQFNQSYLESIRFFGLVTPPQ